MKKKLQPKENHLQKQIHAEYFQTLQSKLLQQSEKLTNIMGQSLIHDKSKKQLKFALSPTKLHHDQHAPKLHSQDSLKTTARLSAKTEHYRSEPPYIRRMKQLYQKIKHPLLHFEDNLKHIKQLGPKERYEFQRTETYNFASQQQEAKEQKVQAIQKGAALALQKGAALAVYKGETIQGSGGEKEKLSRSTKIQRRITELQSLKDTISTQSCKSLKLMREESMSFPQDRISLQDFETINYIAQGKIGHVYTVRHKRTNFLCALKKIPRAVFANNSRMLTQRMREIKIQSFLDHPNIVQLYSVFADQTSLYLLMQLCSSGSLYQNLKLQGRFAEEKIKSIVKQVCHAVQYMHDNDILHRDLKPENILFHESIVKICDFDWSVNSPLLRTTHCGSPVYTSPEIVQGQQYDNKVDIWNIGILTYELLYGRVPFEIWSEEDLSKVVDDDIYFPRSKPASPEIKGFILGCLAKNPKERFTIAKLIDHEFLNPKWEAPKFT